MVAVGSDENKCVGVRPVGELVGAKLCGSCHSFQCCLAAREFMPQDSLVGFYVNDLNFGAELGRGDRAHLQARNCE
jgi:hypothetical protein